MAFGEMQSTERSLSFEMIKGNNYESDKQEPPASTWSKSPGSANRECADKQTSFRTTEDGDRTTSEEAAGSSSCLSSTSYAEGLAGEVRKWSTTTLASSTLVTTHCRAAVSSAEGHAGKARV